MRALVPGLRRGRLGASALLAGLLLLVIGCGPDYKARGAVKGKVTYKKQPLQSGTVMFINANGISSSASLNPNGEYSMPDAPLGDCKVTVTVTALPNDPTVRARIEGKGGGTKMPGEMKVPEGAMVDEGPTPLPSAPVVPKKVVPIDAKYSQPESSGLSFKVEKGDNTYNIDL